MSFKFSPQLAQKLNINPQMIQSIGLMNLSVMELEQAIRKELEENPVLEEKGETLEDISSLEEAEKERLEWTEYTATNINVSKNTADEKYYERHTPAEESLRDHLLWQVNFSGFSESERKILYALIDVINEDGYLTDSVQNISRQHQFNEKDVQVLLKKLQDFDPHGVGAGDLTECLLIQARHIDEDTHDLVYLLKNHLRDLQTKNYERIGSAMNLRTEEVKDIANIIASLDPNPGQKFTSHRTEYVVPDIYILKKEEGVYEVHLNEDSIPQIKIASHYVRFLDRLSNNQDADTKQYVMDKMKRALSFIRALNHRKSSILRVTQLIAEEQIEFLEKGEMFLHPLLLREVSERLNLHLSTVSRVTSNKYVHTPQGVFELKYFFGISYLNKKGERKGVPAVKLMIKDIIESEKNPLSDSKISQKLLELDGIHLSRRQVARFREELGYLSALEREAHRKKR
ncbi:MAG: RNA polymerase factor sigma-54 [Bdellovibrionales bacterium]|nr:RNA polymerase factor sigma-54 [Bdellovibrionales bacterium]